MDYTPIINSITRKFKEYENFTPCQIERIENTDEAIGITFSQGSKQITLDFKAIIKQIKKQFKGTVEFKISSSMDIRAEVTATDMRALNFDLNPPRPIFNANPFIASTVTSMKFETSSSKFIEHRGFNVFNFSFNAIILSQKKPHLLSVTIVLHPAI